jgi:hypothetical protein
MTLEPTEHSGVAQELLTIGRLWRKAAVEAGMPSRPRIVRSIPTWNDLWPVGASRTKVEIKASHALYVSQPKAVARLIEDAAEVVSK